MTACPGNIRQLLGTYNIAAAIQLPSRFNEDSIAVPDAWPSKDEPFPALKNQPTIRQSDCLISPKNAIWPFKNRFAD